MTSQVQKRRGTTSEHSTFTGAEGEITVDTTKDTAVVHDGVTTGGRALAREDLNNVAASTVAAKLSGTGLSSVDINSGNIDGTAIGATTPSTGAFTTLSTTGNITTSGTVDGRDVAADGTKLDGIESGADVTDTTNVTAAGALMDSELTNITAVKALDQGVATTDSPTFSNVTSDIDLTAISTSIADTAVDVFVYDTRKDSDGGAWRHRTQNTSWYNETLNTATRGSRKEFPSVAVIVAESNQVTIYDGDDPSLPMWMVFNAASTATVTWTSTPTAIACLNGILCIATNNRIVEILFLTETLTLRDGIAHYAYIANISERNNVPGSTPIIPNSPTIVNSTVNDIAMTVRSNSIIDTATQLPIPEIAVCTDGNGTYSVSVITDSGAVYDIASDSTGTAVSCAYDEDDNLVVVRSDGTIYIWESPITADGQSPDQTITNTLGTVSLVAA